MEKTNLVFQSLVISRGNGRGKKHAVHMDHLSPKALKYIYYTGINGLLISLFELVCLTESTALVQFIQL